MLAAQEVRHLHHQRQPYDLAAEGVHHLRLHACLVYELDMLVFRSDMANYMSPWVTRSLTRLGRWLVRKTRQVLHNMSHCGVLSWRGVQAKSWTCNFDSRRVHFQGHTQISHLKKGENKMGTSPVSSTSTSVEHGVAVGKRIMQLSMQVSVSVANTKDLLQRQISVVIP